MINAERLRNRILILSLSRLPPQPRLLRKWDEGEGEIPRAKLTLLSWKMCCSLSRTALQGNHILKVKPGNVFPERTKPISWTQNTVVLLRPGTKTRTMKGGQAAQLFPWLEKQMLFCKSS